MRLFITAFLLFQYFFSLGQVKKEDFEAIFKVTPFEKLKRVYVSRIPNPKDYDDWAFQIFIQEGRECSYKLKENCIYIYYEKERIIIIPYDKILRIDNVSDDLKLYLIN